MNELDLFAVAIGIANPVERGTFLDRECAGQTDLRRRLDLLLDAHGRSHNMLDVARAGNADATGAYAPASALVGTVIAGRYKLLEEIGDGGMGSVWMAEQREPVKRLVAVKLIKAGMDSKAVLARFEAERQALALMDHPNIAKVLDGGTTDSEPGGVSPGRPFFVMELVKGLPLTEYCDARRLSVKDRLELFMQICSAVQHAHQKAVIHRDLKPSNILITEHDGKPVPKVIDFGLAKALNASNMLTERTLHTAYGTVVGTPLYMAPEQVGINALDVDTRTDIYALGVILYELLTGSTPLEKARFKEAAWEEVKRLIREEEPPRPSMRLSSDMTLPSLAASRQVEPAQLRRLVRGDLDWIVMKALDKDRSRRYETANGLARDVQRYLTGDAVDACPPTFGYRLMKFVRRNRSQVMAASLVLLALVAGVIGTTLGLLEARRQEQLALIAAEEERQAKEREAERAEGERQAKLEAETKRREAERNLAFAKKGNEILGSVFAGLDPRANYATVAELRNALRDNLTKAVKELEGSAVGDPVEVGDLQDTLGRSLLGLGEPALAVEVHQKAMNTCQARLGPDHQFTLISMANLAAAYLVDGRLDKAVPLFEAALEKQKAKLGPDHHDTLSTMNSLALAYEAGGRIDKALPLLEETLEKRKAKFGPDDWRTLLSMNNLADTYRANGQAAKAVALLEPTFEKMKAKLGPDHPDTLKCMSNLGGAYRAIGQSAKVVPLLEAALERMKAKLGPDHPDTLTNTNNLALAYQEDGQLTKAVQLFEETLAKRKAQLGPDHHDTLVVLSNLATAYFESGQLAKALPLLEETLAKTKARLGPDHPDTLNSMNNLATAYQKSGRLDKAVPLFEETVAKRKGRLGPDHPETFGSMNNLASAYEGSSQFAKALPLLEETLAKTRAKLGPDHPDTLDIESHLASAYWASGQFVKAVPHFEETLRLRKAKFGPDHLKTLNNMNNLAMAYGATGQLAKALLLFEETLQLKKAKLGADHPDTLATKENLALIRRLAAADERFRAKLAELGPNHIDTLLARRDLAQAYLNTNQFDTAEANLCEVLEGMKDRAADDPIVVFTTKLLGACLATRQRTARDHWPSFNSESLFGGALLSQKKYADAERFLLGGYEGMKLRESTIPPEDRTRIADALDRLIELYTATNKPDEVKKWQAERAKYPAANSAGRK